MSVDVLALEDLHGPRFRYCFMSRLWPCSVLLTCLSRSYELVTKLSHYELQLFVIVSSP
jgi:hypothetical protein